MPPCLGSAADAAMENASNDNTAAASACTLRMLSSLELQPHDGPIGANDSMAGHSGNSPTPEPALVLRTIARELWPRAGWCGICAAKTCDHCAPDPSHFELVAALEIEDFAGLVRGRDLEAEALDDLAGERDLLGVRG